MEGDIRHTSEGKILTLCYGDVAVVNTYLPSGNREAERHEYKLKFQDDLKIHCTKLKSTHLVILAGDLNAVDFELARDRVGGLGHFRVTNHRQEAGILGDQ